MEIPAAIKKKYGPLPLWAWGLVALALIYGAMLYRNRSASASSFGNQAPKSNLGTVAGDGSGGGAGSLSLPNTEVAQTDNVPPFTSPIITSDSPSATPADTPQLASAPITAFNSSTLAPGTIVAPTGSGNPFTGGSPGGTITTDPEHNAFVLGQSDVDPFNITSSPTSSTAPVPNNTPDAVDRYLANIAADNARSLVAVPPPPAPVTQKVLPAPVELTPRPTVGHNVAV